MKVSCRWIKDYISIGKDFEDLAYKLTMAGLEVEKVEQNSDDVVFELEITPNRPDCLNHLGIAREASAILNKPLKAPKIKKTKIPQKKANINIQDKKGCLRYIGAIIKNVSVKKAPTWIEERINSIGLRGVNNIVDIANFCLMETGQPMHAFDYDKLAGGKIIVRRAKEGESIVTIDDVERKLGPSVLIIADEQKPVAIAGIMGGREAEVTQSTKNILLESAYFDPVIIRRGARNVGLSSDSSYRFERGVDMETVESAVYRAISIFSKYAGGTLFAFSDVYPEKQKRVKRQVTISKDKIDSFLGTAIPLSRSKTILSKLGFKIASPKKDTLKITPPSFRNDIKEDVDIIEEISRIIGFNNLPISLPLINAGNVSSSKNRGIRENLADALSAQSLSEVVTYAMISKDALQKTEQSNLDTIKVTNPLTKEQEIMRPCLLPSLLFLAFSNINKGQKNFAFFETGKIYPPSGEKETLGIIMTGSHLHDWRRLDKSKIDFYDIKGVIEQAFRKIGISDLQFTSFNGGIFEEGQCARILLEDNQIGHIGKINQDVLDAWDIKQKGMFFAELNIEALYPKIKVKERYQQISEFPPIVRDISIAIKKDTSFQQVRGIIESVGPEYLTSISFAEQYIGDKVPKGSRGIIVSLLYQSFKRTLREDEVNSAHQNICRALVGQLGATLR